MSVDFSSEAFLVSRNENANFSSYCVLLCRANMKRTFHVYIKKLLFPMERTQTNKNTKEEWRNFVVAFFRSRMVFCKIISDGNRHQFKRDLIKVAHSFIHSYTHSFVYVHKIVRSAYSCEIV